MRTQKMLSKFGNPVTNQLVIQGSHKGQPGKFFQSYDSLIAFTPDDGATTILDTEKWDFSVTTGSYRNRFLNEKKAQTQAKINSGEYILENLNA